MLNLQLAKKYAVAMFELAQLNTASSSRKSDSFLPISRHCELLWAIRKFSRKRKRNC